MIWKLLAIIAVLFLVYLIFFKKGREKEVGSKPNNKNEKISDEMVECPTCGTYVSQSEAILSNGKFFCSKECLNK